MCACRLDIIFINRLWDGRTKVLARHAHPLSGYSHLGAQTYIFYCPIFTLYSTIVEAHKLSNQLVFMLIKVINGMVLYLKNLAFIELDTIRIHHECQGGIEKSVTDWHHEAC